MINDNLPKVSIIVNSYKDLYKLTSCVSAIGKTRYNNKEIIVVSYGIPEKTIKTSDVSSYINKLILLKQDLGAPAQRNIGFKARERCSEYVLFIDDDVLLTESAIENLVRVLEMHPYIGVAQPLLETFDQSIDCAGAFIDHLGYTYMPFHGKSISLLNTKVEYVTISYASGACLILRVSFFCNDKCFQPFDGKFYFNYEDADLSLRSWIKGIKVVCIPSAIAIHARGRTALLKLSPKHLVFLNTRNKFLTLTSIFDLKTLFTYIPLFIIFEFIKAVYLLRIEPVHALSVYRAILWCLQNLKKIWMRRKLVMKTAMENNILSSIVFKPAFSTLIREFKAHYSLTRKPA